MTQDRLAMIMEMLESSPNDTFLKYAASLEFKKKGKLEKAINLMQEITNSDPEYLAVYYQLGKLYEENNKLTEAVEIYRTGKTIARKQEDKKALGELTEALMLLDADESDF